MAWIEPRYKDTSNAEELLAEKNFVADSTGKGNYNVSGQQKDVLKPQT